MTFDLNDLKKTKIGVLASFSLLVAAFFIFSDSAVTTSHASFGGPPSGRTGAPGESTCTSCHTASGQTGQFNIVAPAGYTPGQTYSITVQNTTTDTSRLAWGYQVIPLTTANAMAGTIAAPTGTTRIRVSGSKSYAEQSSTGVYPGQAGGSTWSFNWTAPATDVGTVTFYGAGLQADNSGDEAGDQTYTTSVAVPRTVAIVIHHGFTDFDGDGKADPSVFRPSDRFWYLNRSTAGFTGSQWGLTTDKLTPADFDGDDKADIAVWREAPADQAAFYILQSATNTVRVELFGQTGDDPVAVGDWDGDGKADPAVYRDSAFGSQSYFFYRGSVNNPSRGITYLPWGTTGDKAVRADFDGDGKTDPAVFRPSNSVWYGLRSSDGTVRYETWGLPTDKLVPADYDGDGRTDIAVFRNGVWYVKQSSNGLTAYYPWGLSTDALVPADFDGDGKTDPAVYRNGVWYVLQSSSSSMNVMNFGSSTDVPLASSFVR